MLHGWFLHVHAITFNTFNEVELLHIFTEIFHEGDIICFLLRSPRTVPLLERENSFQTFVRVASRLISSGGGIPIVLLPGPRKSLNGFEL